MADPQTAIADQAHQVSSLAQQLSAQADRLANDVTSFSFATGHNADFLTMGLTIFVLACFVGYYVVWRVTPALHSPLMAITNAISSVIIVGALIAAGPAETSFSKIVGFLGVVLVSINIFGGFIVTRRMLHMFKKKS
ncbi:MAG: NAD(P) transhydrogenase subunit alpha [Micavibrio sp.]|nr:NAD(P) transhydrogenase subunit alpha [Micavibrio sp.]HPQ51101.1 NAD(P) transhydrogenase subunit alpha [Alphaproteobacteria bacterium]